MCAQKGKYEAKYEDSFITPHITLKYILFKFSNAKTYYKMYFRAYLFPDLKLIIYIKFWHIYINVDKNIKNSQNYITK